MKLALGLVHGRDVSGYYHHSVTALLTDLMDRDDASSIFPLDSVINCRSGPLLSMGRGVLTAHFLDETDADVLLCIDSDMSFPPATLYQMWGVYQQIYARDPANAILGGLAFISGSDKLDPRFMQPTIWGDFPQGMALARTYPRDSLIEVANTGAACVMIHREVFKTINRHWYHHIPILDWDLLARDLYLHPEADRGTLLRNKVWDADQYGEDMSFCQRAKAAGYKLHIHTGIRFDHAKSVLIGEDDYLPILERDTNGRPDDDPADPTGQQPDRGTAPGDDAYAFPGPRPGPLVHA